MAFWTIGINCKVKLGKTAGHGIFSDIWFWANIVFLEASSAQSRCGRGKATEARAVTDMMTDYMVVKLVHGKIQKSNISSLRMKNNCNTNNGSMDFHLIDQIYPDINQAFPSISNS